MAKIIALAFADIHIHKYRNFNENNRRLNHCLMALEMIGKRAAGLDVPVLFAGDWYHTNAHVETETHGRAMGVFKNHFTEQNVWVFAISGNHDLSERSAMNKNSPSHLDAYSEVFKNFILLDYLPNGTRYKGIRVWGIPYMDDENEMVKMAEIYSDKARKMDVTSKKILLLHGDAPGAVTPTGITIEETALPKDLDKFFEPFDLVLFGHVHKPLRLSKKCYMLGAPLHQDAGDEGTGMGYWEVYSDGNMEFRLLDLPQFKTGEEKNDGNYWVNNKVDLVNEEIETGEFHINTSKKKLALSYLTKINENSKHLKRALIEILNQAE